MGVETIATIAGLALSAAGTGVSIASANAQNEAQNKALQRSLQAQQGYQSEGSKAFQRSLGQSTPDVAQQNVQKGAQEAAALYKNLQNAGVAQAYASPVPKDVQVDSRTQEAIQRMNLANAGTQGYSNMGLQQWLSNQEALQQLGAINSLAQGSASTLPAELSLAGRNAQNMAGLGNLLGTAGQVGGMYGAYKLGRKPGG